MATASLTPPDDTDTAEPYPEQWPFLERNKRFYGFISGTGAGKTFAGVYRLWLNATLWNPQSMGAIIVPDRGMFVDNIKPLLEEFNLLEKWEYNSVYTDEPGLRTETDQRILILSADNQRQIERIKGKNLAYWWMDEEAEIPPRAREIAEQRLRVGTYPNGFITTTPDGFNHTYDFFVDDIDSKTYPSKERYPDCEYGQIYESTSRLAIVGVPPEANPKMRPEDIAAMRRSLPEQIVAQELQGEFIEIGAGLYSRNTFTFVDSDTLSADKTYTYLVGVDPAVTADANRAEDADSDYWAATLCALDRVNETLYAVDTKRERGMTLTQGAEWVAAIAQQANARVLVESNQAQRWLAQELQDYNLQIQQVQSTANKEDKLIGMSIPIENDLVQFVNHEYDERLGYDPRWQPLVQEALAFPEGSHDDLLDSLNLVVDNTSIHNSAVLPTEMYGKNDE
jgi:phage terminase large subunit-like protein